MGTTKSKNEALINPAARPASPPPHVRPPPGSTRDWAELPRDVQWNIFIRLPSADILRGAGLVCASWRRCSVDEPTLWRHIDVGSKSNRDVDGDCYGRVTAARAAVDRSAGLCESFRGPADCDFLAYLSDSAPSLRSLHVTSSTLGLKELADKTVTFPRLERLELSCGCFSTALRLLFAFLDRSPRLEVLVSGYCYFNLKDYESSLALARLKRMYH